MRVKIGDTIYLIKKAVAEEHGLDLYTFDDEVIYVELGNRKKVDKTVGILINEGCLEIRNNKKTMIDNFN